jgi:hypothetical protein
MPKRHQPSQPKGNPSCRTSRSAAALAVAGPASAAVAPGGNAPPPYAPTASSPTTQSIIMKDGNICDPIRHMGC